MWMWERAQLLGIPLMAGSSLPTLWRSPRFLEYPLDVELDEALSLGCEQPLPLSPSVSEPAAGPGAALFIGTFHNAVALLTGSQPANPPPRADGSSPLGGPEAYGFHALEVLQCMVERRNGGETGVRTVQYMSGEAVWRARDEGLWSGELAEAAVAAVLAGGTPPAPIVPATHRPARRSIELS